MKILRKDAVIMHPLPRVDEVKSLQPHTVLVFPLFQCSTWD